MNDSWEEKVNHHAGALVQHTMKAADQGPVPLPEDELARLGQIIAIEWRLLIDAMGALLDADEPDAAAPGVAEFDAGFVYGLAFAKALEETRIEYGRLRKRHLLRIVKGRAAAPTR
jgi:hypothetical protein